MTSSVSRIPIGITPRSDRKQASLSELTRVSAGSTGVPKAAPLRDISSNRPLDIKADARKRPPSFMAPTASTVGKSSRDPSPRVRTSSPLEKQKGIANVTLMGRSSVSKKVEEKVTIPLSKMVKMEECLKEKEDEIERMNNKLKDLEEVVKMRAEIIDNKSMKVDSLELKLLSAQEKAQMLEEKIQVLDERCSVLASNEIRYKEEIVESTRKLGDSRKDLVDKDAVIRKLLNDVVDLKGQIRVAVRVRPSLPGEDNLMTLQYPSQSSIRLDMNGKMTTLEYQKVYGPNISQQVIFEDVEELVMSSLHGYNVAIVAYGQTGSGKTYTMIGGDGKQEGLIPRSARTVFNNKSKLAELGWKFDITASFLEIYVEEAFDLLNNRQKVQLRMGSGNCVIDGVVAKQIDTEDDINWILHVAGKSRSVAATKCNEQSSRSHAVFQINIFAKNEIIGTELNSSLSLVDLAGSERAKESGSDENKERFKEMTAINLGLSSLQKCIRSQLNKNSHIPYRDSKLTQLLMNSLGGGDSKTMVIVGLNPSFSQEAETKRSLEFAQQMSLTKIGAAMRQTK